MHARTLPRCPNSPVHFQPHRTLIYYNIIAQCVFRDKSGLAYISSTLPLLPRVIAYGTARSTLRRHGFVSGVSRFELFFARRLRLSLPTYYVRCLALQRIAVCWSSSACASPNQKFPLPLLATAIGVSFFVFVVGLSF